MNKAKKTLREPIYVLHLKFYKLPQHLVEQHQIDSSTDNLEPKLQFDKNSQDSSGGNLCNIGCLMKIKR
jgi:hypothetical protein